MTDAGPPGAIVNVQALRAVAALLVVLYHLRAWISAPGLDWQAGQAGVDIFFVISGFIIGFITVREREVSTFLRRRILRVVPLYWGLTIAVFVAALVTPIVLNGHSPAPYELVKSLLFIPYVAPDGAKSPLVFLGWTLNFEMFFYVAFAVAMILSYRHRIAIVSVALGGIVAGGALAGRPDAARSPVLATYLDPIMLEFVAGMGLSAIWPHVPRWIAEASLRRAIDGVAIVGGSAAVVAIGFSGHAIDEITRVVLWGVPAVAIVAAALWAEARGVAVSGRTVLLLGAASYALYLTHPFVIKAVAIAAAHGPPIPPAALGLATLLATVAVAVAVHLIVEKPMARWLRARFDR